MSNVMLYWVTATAALSARLYWKSFGWKRITTRRVAVPTGVAVFLKEIITPMRKWMESRFTDVQHWSDMPKGSHFGAFEQPELLVRDVRTFFRPLRQS
jgi:pimeloyl-ACP methyl ester carboxylesterase